MSSFVTLNDQELLNKFEIAACNRICDWVDWSIARRKSYIEKLGLDKEVYIPNGQWDWAPQHASFRIVKQQKHFDILRLCASQFSGYNLYQSDFGGDGLQEVAPIHELEKKVVENLKLRGGDFFEKYLMVTKDLPPELLVSAPARFGEIGIYFNKRVINHDTYIYQNRIRLMAQTGILKSPAESNLSAFNRPDYTIVEIGSGYGALSYHLSKILPEARIIMVDLPESLVFAAMYTSILSPNLQNRFGWEEFNVSYPRAGFTYLPNYQFPELVNSGIKADLVINTLSMSEMTTEQVSEYGKGIRQMLKPDGVFYEQNFNNEPIQRGINAKVVLERELPAVNHFGMQDGGELSLWSNSVETLSSSLKIS